MSDLTAHELSYLIQESQGFTPEILEALVGTYAPGVYAFAQDLLPDGDEHPDDSLALTTETFRAALESPEKVQFFDNPQSWLYATALIVAGKHIRSSPVLGKKVRRDVWIFLLLRYKHRFPIPQIADITGQDQQHIHSILNSWRRKHKSIHPPSSGNHQTAAIQQALDGLTPWQNHTRDAHLRECPDCRAYLGDLQAVESAAQADFDARPHLPFSDHIRLQILESVSQPAHKPQPRFSESGSREFLWLGTAIVSFLLLALYLNPFWTSPPEPAPPTPTLPPPAEPLSQVSSVNYEALTRAMQFAPLPIWRAGKTLSGRWIPTTPIAVSNDGLFAAFGSEDQLILWNLEENTQAALGGIQEGIVQLVFRSSEYLGTLHSNGELRIWEISRGTALYVLTENEITTGFAFSRDGTTLIASTGDSIGLWRFSGNNLIRYRRIPQAGAAVLALSGDGELLAAADGDGLVTLWNLDTATIETRFNAVQTPVVRMSFSQGSNRLAVQARQGRIEILGLSRPPGEQLTLTRISALGTSSNPIDFAWTPDGRYIAALDTILEDDGDGSKLSAVYFWEMTTGLPARQPLTLPPELDTARSIHITNDLTLRIGTSEKRLYLLEAVQPANSPAPTLFNQSLSDLFPVGIVFQSAQDPFTESYNLSLEAAADRIALELSLTDILPEEFTAEGAAYDREARIATFLFTRTAAPYRDEQILLRVRAHIPGRPLMLQEDWISAQAEFSQVQIGKFLGETVQGEWTRSVIDEGMPGILRWTDAQTTRLRWRQGNYIFELLSRSKIASERTRWNILYQPLAMAITGVDEHTPLIDYTIAAGDTCSGIAARFGTTVETLSALNDLDENCLIVSGDSLQIPMPQALGIFAEEDLNCDGSPERLRLIPDPLQPTTSAYYGMVIEALPGSGTAPDTSFTPFASITIADIDVDFFKEPELVQVENTCGVLIALTGFGGAGEEEGLRIYAWTGEELRLLLKADGFTEQNLQDDLSDDNTFTTQRLEYNSEAEACELSITTYIWATNGFVETGRDSVPGTACFNPSDND